MNKLKFFFSFSFLLMPFAIRAQWLAMPQVTNSCYRGIPVSTKIMLPVGDGKIVYTTYCSQPHGGVTNVYQSNDHLATSELKYTNEPYEYGKAELTGLEFYNDSTFSYFIVEDTRKLFYFTQDLFKSRVNMIGYSFPYNNVFSSAVTSKYVYMIGFGAGLKIFRSGKTGGSDWEQKITDYNAVQNRLKFINDSTGYTIATHVSNTSKSSLFRLTNFGANWLPVLTDSIDNIVDFQIFDNGDILVLKRSGLVLKSFNSGISFNSLSAPSSGTYTCLHFANDSVGFIGGLNGTLLKTMDGGITWSSDSSNSENNIIAINTYKKNYYFRDASGTVYRYKLEPDPVAIEDNFEFKIFPSPTSEV
jgi:hypothetical protein